MALLDVPMATVHDLAKTSRVPRAKLYEVLEVLNRRGLVEIIPETPLRYRAGSITSFFEHRVADLRTEEQELKRTVGEISVYLAQTPKAAESEGKAGFLHIQEGRTHFSVNLRRLIQETQAQLVIVGDRLVLPRLRLYEEILRNLALLSQRRTVRILVPEDAVDVVDGRRVHVDELSGVMRRGPFPVGDAFVAVRDHQEWLLARFLPNDLHPSKGSDRIVVGRDAEMALLWDRLIGTAWDTSAPARSG